MSPTSLPLPPSTDELAEQIIQDFEDIADRISEFLEEAGVLLQDQ